MWTNLKILLTVVATLLVFTTVANVIPQVQSAVPEDIELRADMSPEELASIGEDIFNGIGGCTACHGLGTRAPDLIGVAGSNCAIRNPELSCKEYLWESLVNPLAYVVEGFQPIMLDQSRTLSQPQLWTLVAFLETQGGEVTVSAADFAAALAAGAGDAAAAGGETTAEAPTDPGQVDAVGLITSLGCLACHSLDGQGGQVGPPFENLRGRDADFIRTGILEPNADTAAGFEAFAGTMPPTFGGMISPAELEALIQFLGTGEVGGGETEGADPGEGADR